MHVSHCLCMHSFDLSHLIWLTNSLKLAYKLVNFSSFRSKRWMFLWYKQSQTMLGVLSNTLIFTGHNSQNFDRPIGLTLSSWVYIWCASFMDIRRYQICSFLFIFSPVSISFWITCKSNNKTVSYSKKVIHIIVKVFHFLNCPTFQTISWGLFQILYLKSNLFSNFCSNKALFSWKVW